MVTHWLLLLAGIFLNWFPTVRVLHPKVKLRTYQQMLELGTRKRRRPWWWLPGWWLTPLQAYAGVWCLQSAFEFEPEATGFVLKVPLLVTGAVLGVAVIARMALVREDDRVLAPFGLVLGMSFALMPLTVAIPAAILAVASTSAMKGVPAFFLMGAVFTLGIGLLMLRVNLWVLLTTAIYAFPVAVTFAQSRFLSLPSRN